MFNFKAIFLGIFLALAGTSGAFAQCGTQAPANKVCGNNTGVPALAGWITVSPGVLTPIAAGTVLGNPTGATAVPVATRAPVLGQTGVGTGVLSFNGITSGSASITPQSVAGTPILVLPNTSGTFAVNATTPLVLNSTTGALTCPTCATSSGGGAITGTAPISVSAAGVVSINAPYVTLTASNGGVVYSGATNLAILAGTATARQMLQSGATAAPAWSTAVWPATTAAGTTLVSATANTVTATSTPVLGVAGSLVGSIGFQNLTSGTVTLQPATGALGTVTITVPGTTGTMAVNSTAPVTLSATGVIACATCGVTTNPLSQFASTTSSQLAGIISDETGTGSLVFAQSPTLGGSVVVSSNSSSALVVGPNGATNPVLSVDASAGTAATGWAVRGAAAGGNAFLTVASSGTNEGGSINAKGSGGVNIGNTSTGGVAIGGAGGGIFLTLGSDATGDIFYRGAGGGLVRVPIGSNTNVLTVSGGLPSWQAGATAASVTVGTTTISGGTNQALLYNNAGVLGNSGISSFLTAGAGIALSGTTNATVALALTNQTFVANPGAPTGTSSATGVMMGLGATCKVTPTYSGRLQLSIHVTSTNASNAQNTMSLRYGTGAAPSNGAALSGTVVETTVTGISAGVGTNSRTDGYVTGLSPGTQYWFDSGLATTTGTGSINGIACYAREY